MNIKKVISLSFLLLANISMLAHAVAFHHHDRQLPAVICTENQKHHCDENTEPHNCPDTEHSGKCCTIENCLLSSPFTKADGFELTKSIANNFDIIINNIPVYQTVQIINLVGLPFRQNPYVPLFYSEFIAQSIGLRAPPAC